MNEIVEEVSIEDIFSIIALSGEAKSKLYEAFDLAKEEKYEEAEELLIDASNTLSGAHAVQTKLITSEAQGNKTEIGILMVHAQDHLMNTILTKELMNNNISMQKQINELKNKLGGF